MNEQQFGNKVRHLLNEGLRVEAGAAERLRAAREQALSRQRPQSAAALAWADNVLGRFDGWGDFSLRLVLPVALLVAGIVAVYVWQGDQRIAEVEELDAQLLADDLPIDAYLDRGFQNWLKKRAAEQ